MTFIKTYSSADDFVEGVLGKCATYEFKHSSEIIEVHEDLTVFGIEDLGKILSFYRSLSIFITEEALKADMKSAVIRKQFNTQLTLVMEEVQEELPKGSTLTAIKNKAMLDDKVSALDDAVMEIEYIHKALKSREESLEKMIGTISRELTRREMKHAGVV